MPKLLLRRIIHFTLLLVLLTTGTLAALLVSQGRQFASPDRRPLQPYHLDYLQNAKTHGIRIDKLNCQNGDVPTLVVTPDPQAALGQRGTLICKQLTSLGNKLQPNGTIKANLVLLHGRNGRKVDLLPVAERFCATGFRCIIPDLPAHGESPIIASHFGLAEWEKQIPTNVLKESADHFQFDENPKALWGMSMGGSFATAAASIGGSWDCLIIVSSFDQLDTVIAKHCQSHALARTVSSITQHFGGPDICKVTPSKWAKSVT